MAALTGGATQAVGSFIGQQMGLSGAAATSAGLAWLGGGSLAAGGSGMAGGIFLVSAATHTVAKGAGLAIRLAGTSSSAFISELAKLDVVIELGGRSAADAISALRALEPQLAKSRKQAVEEDGGYRLNQVFRTLGKAMRNPEKIADLPNDVKRGLERSEATNLAAAQRAVEYEIRHLTSEPWKRAVQKGTRLFSMPALSKPLDRL